MARFDFGDLNFNGFGSSDTPSFGIQLGDSVPTAANQFSTYGLNSDFGMTPNTNVLGGGGILGGLNELGESFAKNAPLLNFGASALTGLGSLYQGNKQMSLFKDQLNTQKDQWQQANNLNKQMVNEQLADRQARRIAGNPTGGVTSVEDYMKTWGV